MQDKDNSLYLFLLNDEHNEIVEGHRYMNAILEEVDLHPETDYKSMEIESANFRRKKGGYHQLLFKYTSCEDIDAKAIEQFNILLESKSFTPDKRCLDCEYYFMGLMPNKPDYMSSDLFSDFTALLINQIVFIEEIEQTVNEDDYQDYEDEESDYEFDNIMDEDDDEEIEDGETVYEYYNENHLIVYTTCTHSPDFYDNIEDVLNGR